MTRTAPGIVFSGVLVLLLAAPGVHAQPAPENEQIEAAVQAAPPELREGARVLGYNGEGVLITLREGTNHLICLSDDPADSRVHVACYHESLEPFMSRGRELRAEGLERGAVDSVRLAEVRSGELSMPDHPATLYSLSGSEGSANAGDGLVSAIGDAKPLHVVYVPYATGESTGLPTRPEGGRPWLMEAGSPWAHIMISP